MQALSRASVSGLIFSGKAIWSIVLFAAAFLIILDAVGIRERDSYDNCVLEYAGNVENTVSAHLVMSSCREKFPIEVDSSKNPEPIEEMPTAALDKILIEADVDEGVFKGTITNQNASWEIRHLTFFLLSKPDASELRREGLSLTERKALLVSSKYMLSKIDVSVASGGKSSFYIVLDNELDLKEGLDWRLNAAKGTYFLK